MEEIISDCLLKILKENDDVAWVVDQLNSSFAEGITERAKESEPDFDKQRSPFREPYVTAEEGHSFSKSDRKKRGKYGTSRIYSEREKIELIEFAMGEIFLTLPEIEKSSFSWLQSDNVKVDGVEFLDPDNEIATPSYKKFGALSNNERRQLSERLDIFLKGLRK